MARLLVLSLLAFTVCALGFLQLVRVYDAAASSSSLRGLRLVHRIDRAVRGTQKCERHLEGRALHRSVRSYTTPSRPYRLWALRLWRHRGRRCSALAWHLDAYPPRAIMHVFASDSAQALHVAGVEAGSGNIWAHPYCTGAVNGQFLGCFQMGRWARSRYGHGVTALAQAWAARRYVLAAGWCSGWAQTAWGC